MATKRSAPHVHPSRQDQVPTEPRRKRQKPNNAGPKSFKKAHPVNELKSQVRSLKRLLEHNGDLPADVRVEKERALQTAQYELAESQKTKKRSEMIGKYHKIRFFDRQKASKRHKQARKELQGCEEDDVTQRKELARRVEDAEVDVNYAQYYPLDQPYVSLFPRKKIEHDLEEDEDARDGQSKAVERKGDPEMWQRVKKCMQDGTLDALRNGKLTDAHNEEAEDEGEMSMSPVKKKKKLEKAPSWERTKPSGASTLNANRSDDESDGGFFE